MVVEKLEGIGTRSINVLSEAELASLREYCRKPGYRRMPKGNGTFIFYKDIPKDINEKLTAQARFNTGKNLKDIISFVRLNTSVHDIEFRIHADQDIFGQKPTVAGLFYLDSSNTTGTAFFKHPVYGKRAIKEEHYIFTEDDNQWEIYDMVYSESNSMITYDAQLYHARQPWVSQGKDQKDGRIVLVKFMRESNE
jgi:hypothetical protein